MISLILLKLLTFSQILQRVPKLSSSTVYENTPVLRQFNNSVKIKMNQIWFKMYKCFEQEVVAYSSCFK